MRLHPNPAVAALVSPYMPSLPRTPELTSIYMTSGLDVPLESKDWGWLASEQDVAHLGGAWHPPVPLAIAIAVNSASAPDLMHHLLCAAAKWRLRCTAHSVKCASPPASACSRLLLLPTLLHLLVVPRPGLVNVRQNVGGGSFLAGYKRHFADFSSLEVRSWGCCQMPQATMEDAVTS